MEAMRCWKPWRWAETYGPDGADRPPPRAREEAGPAGPRRTKNARVSDQERAEMFRLRGEGLTLSEIAEALGISQASVRLRLTGVPAGKKGSTS